MSGKILTHRHIRTPTKIINSLKCTHSKLNKSDRDKIAPHDDNVYIAHKNGIFAAEWNSHVVGTISVILFCAWSLLQSPLNPNANPNYPTYYPSIISVGYPWKNGPSTTQWITKNEQRVSKIDGDGEREREGGKLNGTNKMEIIASKLSAHISYNLCWCSRWS